MRLNKLSRRLFNNILNPNKSYSVVRPQKSSPKISPSDIPDGTPLPPYAFRGIPPPAPTDLIEIKSGERVAKMRRAGKLARNLLKFIEPFIIPGVTTDEIDSQIFQTCVRELGVYPSPLNYRGFPKSVCTSVNNVACHGIPDSRSLENGDIINVDVTIFTPDSVHCDCSKTFAVGNDVDENGRRLLAVAEKALWIGIHQVGPGKLFSSIGKEIENFVIKQGYSIVPIFTGHGIGSNFHECPDIFHFEHESGLEMSPGMTFTIEPVVSEKSDTVKILQDGWTAISVDDSRSAQFEHTILVTEDGFEVLTL